MLAAVASSYIYGPRRKGRFNIFPPPTHLFILIIDEKTIEDNCLTGLTWNASNPLFALSHSDASENHAAFQSYYI